MTGLFRWLRGGKPAQAGQSTPVVAPPADREISFSVIQTGGDDLLEFIGERLAMDGRVDFVRWESWPAPGPKPGAPSVPDAPDWHALRIACHDGERDDILTDLQQHIDPDTWAQLRFMRG